MLLRMGLVRRYRLNARAGRWSARADAVVPSSRLAVFVHGCFWHGCPKHFRVPRTNTDWWTRKVDATRGRDVRDVEVFKAHGWLTAVLWECESDGEWERKVRCVLYG